MKFVAVTYGAEGYTRPMALLCRALMDAGHSATLLADTATLGYAAALGVKAGLAPAPVPAKGLRADQLARAIDEASKDTFRDSAAGLALSIAAEDGLQSAVAAIEAAAIQP